MSGLAGVLSTGEGRLQGKPRVLSPELALAQFAGFALAALVNAAMIASRVAPWRPNQWLVHWLAASSFLTFGLLVIGATQIWRRFGPNRTHWSLVAITAVAVAVGSFTLQDDLSHFSQEHAGSWSPRAVLLSGIVAISLLLPFAVVVGRWLARSLPGSALGLAAAVAILVANDILLPNDYFGLHLYLAWTGATLAGSALSRQRFARARAGITWFSLRPRAAQAALALGGLLCLSGALLFPPPGRVAVALARSDGAAFYRLLARLRALGGTRLALRQQQSGAWFRDRSQLPAIAPSSPRLVPENAVVILITVDALRADVINSRKYDAELPVLAKLRGESVWFSEARAAATLTKLSLSALFMSTYFSQQYWTPSSGDKAHAPREDESPRFPQLLQKRGVRTVTFQSIQWLGNGNGSVRGFDEEHYVPYPKAKSYYTPSPPIFEQLIPLLEGLDARPAFIYSHLSDPHAPYTLGKARKGNQFERYLSEVAVVDQELGRLLEVMERPELRSRAVLILSADHGEAFGEHNSRTHGTTLYDETLRVPLLVRLPDRRSRRVDTRVGLIDLGPSILDLMGAETPGHFMGESLVPFLRGQNPKLTRPLMAETRFMQTFVTEQGIKVFVDPRQDRIECYDIQRDPLELDNLADSPEVLDAPLSTLRYFFEVHRLKRPGYEPPFVR
jgi:arylsulfatase A-like enzyme